MIGFNTLKAKLKKLNTMKQSAKINNKKRVFIDLEYINHNDLKKALDKLFLLISEGKESHEEIRFYQTSEMLSAFKQWYVYNYRDIQEIETKDKLIHIVKSKIR